MEEEDYNNKRKHNENFAKIHKIVEAGVIEFEAKIREYEDIYQELFNYFFDEHDLVLTHQEMQEIRHECRKIDRKLNENNL